MMPSDTVFRTTSYNRDDVLADRYLPGICELQGQEFSAQRTDLQDRNVTSRVNP
jgi:hypothetical protein